MSEIKLEPLQPKENMNLNRKPDENSFDYVVEAVRIVVMIFVVIIHLNLYTQLTGKSNIVEYLFTADGSDLLLFLPVMYCMGTLIFLSGFVYGIRNDFENPGSLTKKTYITHTKKRFLRLYLGFYLALITVLIAKLIVSFPMQLTPLTIFLDITNLWGLIFGTGGDIWPEGWFIAAVFWLALAYPFIRRLMEINKNYIYLLIFIGISLKIFFIAAGLYGYAYTHPFAWLGEFCGGILYGNSMAKKGKSPRLADTKAKKVIVKLGARVFPMYLAHSAVIVFISFHPPLWESFVGILCICVLSEIFYRFLDYKDKYLKKKGII